MIWWCEHQPSHSGRRPQRRRQPGPLAGAVGRAAGRVAGRFARADLRRRARGFVPRAAGGPATQELLDDRRARRRPQPRRDGSTCSRAVWDEDRVRDDLRDDVVEHLGDPQAVLVVDETGDLKKGTTTVGVKRQYTGTAGRVDNAHVAVYLVYAGSRGHAVSDRELYLPRSWTDNPEPLQAAGVPGPDRVYDQAGPGHGDAVPRAGRRRPGRLGRRRRGRRRQPGPARRAGGPPARLGAGGRLRPPRPGRVAAARAPTPCSATSRRGRGSRYRAGPAPRATAWTTGRLWVWTTTAPRPTPRRAGIGAWSPQPADRRAGLLRCSTPRPTLLAVLVRVAGCRWTVEERFQTGEGLCGLDQHQVRRWRSWYRWAIVAMLAHALLVVAAVTERAQRPPPSGLIGLTCNEIQHLFAALVIQPVADAAHRLRWSVWRRRHQARARSCHYRRHAPSQHEDHDLRLEYWRARVRVVTSQVRTARIPHGNRIRKELRA